MEERRSTNNTKKQMEIVKKKKGSILIFSLILFFVMLAISVSIASISVGEKKSAGVTDNSAQAFQLADTASEVFITKAKAINRISELDADPFRCETSAGNPNNGKLVMLNPPNSKTLYTVELFHDNAGTWESVHCATSGALLINTIDKIKVIGISNGTARATEVSVNGGAGGAFACGTDTVADADGNSYATVLVGAQCWIKKNLNTGSMMASSAVMPLNNGTVEKWCSGTPDGNTVSNPANCPTYGGLYTWNEAMGYQPTECNGGKCQGICPAGWHIPTDAEWTALESAVGANPATKLKPGGTSGFDALFAGQRSSFMAGYYDVGMNGFFWSSTQSNASDAWRRWFSGSSAVDRASDGKNMGYSVRCLKD